MQNNLHKPSPLRNGGLLMLLAVLSFTLNDTCIKFIGLTLPMGEIIVIRGVACTVFLALIAGWYGVLPQAKHAFNKFVLIRSLLDVAITFLFLSAVNHIALANLTAILQSVPLMVAVLSVLFLHEKVGRGAGVAIVVGLIGVVLVMRPSPASFTAYELEAVVVVFIIALRELFTKQIANVISIYIVALANSAFVTVAGLCLVFWQPLTTPTAGQVAILMLAAMFLASGYLLLVITLRRGNLSATAPFRYSGVLYAIIIGIIGFGEYPDFIAYLGMGLIVLAGIYAAQHKTA